MKRINFIFTTILIIGILMPFANAKEIKKWSDVAELGFVETSGNTNVATFFLNNTLRHLLSDRLEGTWNLHLLYSENDGEKKGQKYATDLRLDFKFTPRAYSFGLASWLRDKFAGLDSRHSFGAGTGYTFLNSTKHTLLGEVGFNYTIDKLTDQYLSTKFPPELDKTVEYVGGRAYGEYGYSFTKKNKFTVWGEYLPDFEDDGNYNINAEAALISSLNGFFSLKASYRVKYDNEPPAGATDTDKILSVNLLINII